MAGEAFRNWLEDTEAEDALLTPLLALVFATAVAKAGGAKKLLSKSLSKESSSPPRPGLTLQRIPVIRHSRWGTQSYIQGYWKRLPEGAHTPQGLIRACADAAAASLERLSSYYQGRAAVYEKPEVQELAKVVREALERGEKTIEGKAISTYVKEKLGELGLEKSERPSLRARFNGIMLYGALATAVENGVLEGAHEVFGGIRRLSEIHTQQAEWADRVEGIYRQTEGMTKQLRASGAAKNLAVAEALAIRQLLREKPNLPQFLRAETRNAISARLTTHIGSLRLFVAVADALKARLTGAGFSDELLSEYNNYIEAIREKEKAAYELEKLEIGGMEAQAEAVNRLEPRATLSLLPARDLQVEVDKVFAERSKGTAFEGKTFSEARKELQEKLKERRKQFQAAQISFMAKFIEEFAHGTLYTRAPEGRRQARKLAALYRDVATNFLGAVNRIETLREHIRILKAEGKVTSAAEAELKKEQVKKGVWEAAMDAISACVLAPVLGIPVSRGAGRALATSVAKAISEIESVQDWSNVSAWHLLEAPTGALADVLSRVGLPSFRKRAEIIRGLVERYPEVTEEVAKFCRRPLMVGSKPSSKAG
jgi:hypothetical protein